MAKSQGQRHYSKRSGLFVVRIWREEQDLDRTENTTGVISGTDVERMWRWGGRIQRAVSGEEHHFQGWPDLIEVLEGMLSDTPHISGRGRTTRKREGKPNAEDSAGRKCE